MTKILRFFFLPLILACLLSQCASNKAKPYDFPRGVDTTNKTIEYQSKKIYSIPQLGLHADNRFDGARLNGFSKTEDGGVRVDIKPENTPINPSAYYAFKIWSDDPQEIVVELNYLHGRHRYYPKLSKDGKVWSQINSANFWMATDTINAYLRLNLTSDTLWVAAQELNTSEDVKKWCLEKAQHPDVNFSIKGKSKLGRDLIYFEIGKGDPYKKEAIIILSRQHPPEVTGYLAMQAFINGILEDTPIANAFREKFRILVFPLMNPDGVDLGHWRHNSGGVDLNRDWAFYNQAEVKQVADYFAQTLKKNKNSVILGLDFHSTARDVFYTMTDETPSKIKGFKDYWLQGIQDAFPGYTPARDAPSGPLTPTSKNWFAIQYEADAVTYEIGDETPRDFILIKGRVSAYEMMKLLVLRE